ncbi:MAG: hypothetical protein GF344_02075 [Chitinivibrionales bacterium]|nr:hypothetical protein [Chitinivibrionales bacterium]MBD3355881.1 hypothetical protein [Chitinivibrionales bacterium]
MDFEKILPILFLILWTIFASLGRRKSKKSPQSSEDAAGPNRTNERPQRRNPRRPTAPKPQPIFQDIRQTIENMFDELGEAVQKDIPPKSKEMRTSKHSQKVRKVTGSTRIEKAEGRSAAERHEPEELDLESMQPAPEKLRPVSLEPQASLESFQLRSRAELRRAVVWSEIIDKPVSLRDRPMGVV